MHHRTTVVASSSGAVVQDDNKVQHHHHPAMIKNDEQHPGESHHCDKATTTSVMIDEELPLHHLGGRPAAVVAVPRKKRMLQLTTTASTQIRIACLVLLGVPYLLYGNLALFGSNPAEWFTAIRTAWDALLHMNMLVIVMTTILAAILSLPTSMATTTTTSWFTTEQWTLLQRLGRFLKDNRKTKWKTKGFSWKTTTMTMLWCLKQMVSSPAGLSVALLIFFLTMTSAASFYQVVDPGWMWNPFLWFGMYRVYWPHELQEPVQQICWDHVYEKPKMETFFARPYKKEPLCLQQSQWDVLSSGSLSNQSPSDVDAVFRGMQFAHSHGLVLNVMGRDVVEHIPSLRQNANALAPFFQKLVVVIFENDSTDGSRQAFVEWQQEPDLPYQVDLMDCTPYGGSADCHFGKSPRYYSKEANDFWTSSAIGDLHIFRQRSLDYILDTYYSNDYYSHMLILDLDLHISLSPLGMMHTLGQLPNSVVASSCRQPWPGALGSLIPPYDFNAFRAMPSPTNAWLRHVQRVFCDLMPPGDRWRNICDGASSMQLAQILLQDRGAPDIYPVSSAYNGATLYPLQALSHKNVTYHPGKDGQQCEHVAFHQSIPSQMYVNRKWAMHISPTLPGGPKGERAIHSIQRVASLPQIAIWMFCQTFLGMLLLILSTMTFTLHFLLPTLKSRRRTLLEQCSRTTTSSSSGAPTTTTDYPTNHLLVPQLSSSSHHHPPIHVA